MDGQQAEMSDYKHSVTVWLFFAIARANTHRLMACMIGEFCLNDCTAPFCSEAAEFGRNESVQLFEIVLWAQ